MLSVLVGAIAAASFQGGSAADLAKSLSESTKSNVIIEADMGMYLKPFEYNPDNLDEMARAVAKTTSLRRVAGSDNVFFFPTLPSWQFDLGAVRSLVGDGSRATGGGPLPADATRDGNVTLQSKPRTAVSVASLQGHAWTKSLRIDPYFHGMSLAVWVADLPERDFLNFVAKAVGGKIALTKDGYSIEPNGDEIRRRALATMNEAKKSSEFQKQPPQEKASLELSLTVVSNLSASQVAKLVGTGEPLRFEIGANLRGAVGAYLKSLMESPAEAAQGFGPPSPPGRTAPPQPGPAGTERFRNINRRLLGFATISKGFRVTLELASVDESGRSGPPIRVP